MIIIGVRLVLEGLNPSGVVELEVHYLIALHYWRKHNLQI